MPPRCMNTVCCWLLLDHLCVPRHHRQQDPGGQSSLGESEQRRPLSAAWGLAHSRGLDEEGRVPAALLVLREDLCFSVASLGRPEAESPVDPPCVSPASGSPHTLDRAPLGTFSWVTGWLSWPLLPWRVPLYLSSGFFSP